MADRESFLRTVRESLGARAGRDVEPDPSTHLADSPEELRAALSAARERSMSESDRWIEELAARAEMGGWRVHRTASPEDAAEVILSICREAEATRVLRSRHDVFDAAPVDRVLSAAGIDNEEAVRGTSGESGDEARLRLREKTFAADIGITGVDYAVAETGTAVINARDGVSRLLSVAPRRHIAVVRRDEVVPSLDELFLWARAEFLEGGHRGMLNLITGPSRSADIGGEITVGVHGPVEVHMVIVG